MSFSNELIKILDDLGKRFGIAIDWTKQNVMPYIEDLGKRIIKYETTIDLIGFLWTFLLTTGFII